MEIRLGYMRLNGEDYEINFADVISKEEFEQIEDASKIINQAAFNKNLFRIFTVNIGEFFDYLSILLKSCIENKNELLSKGLYLNCNRLYINLLSSFRTYLDHSETYLKKNYGNTSSQYLEFQACINSIYDFNFSYRFIYKLRNYSQHCGLPINSISYSAHEDRSTKVHHHNLDINFDKEELLKNYSEWGKKVESDLVSQPSKMDVKVITQILHSCMIQVFNKLELIDKPKVDTSINLLISFINRIKIEGVHVCIFTDIQRPELDKGLKFSVVDLSLLLHTHFNE